MKVTEEFSQSKKEAEEKIAKLKEALIEFCKRENAWAVFGSEKKVTVKEQESIKLPGKGTEKQNELIELLQDLNRYSEVLDLDVYALKKAIDKKEWEVDELAQLNKFVEKIKNYRFTVGKK